MLLALVSFAALPWFVSAAAITLIGWHATSNLRYVDSEYSSALLGSGTRRRVLLTALCTLDRFLAGQILIAWGIGRTLILVREFVTGISGISPQAAERNPQHDARASAQSKSWMTLALQTVSTATRVQTRLAGHVARELGQQSIVQRALNTPTPAAEAAPSSLQRIPPPPLSSCNASRSQPASLGPAASFAYAAAAALPPSPRTATPWSEGEEEEEGDDEDHDGHDGHDAQEVVRQKEQEKANVAAEASPAGSEIDRFIAARSEMGQGKGSGPV